MCALLAARGGVHRLLGSSQSAYRDFSMAEELLDSQDMVSKPCNGDALS
jgi:hypothetical protein